MDLARFIMRPSLIILFCGYALYVHGSETYTQRFLQLYDKIHDASNGYFSPEGIPYHAPETLIVESVDQGHETTSETYSYYIWLEAMHGAVNKNYSSFNIAWNTMEKYIIPGPADQPNTNKYNPSHPSTYSPELDTPNEYPSPSLSDVPVGQDPLYQELVDAYGNTDIYAMHWLSDVDNVYGFGDGPGNCEAGPSSPGPSYINTYQRGSSESIWRTIPQTTCDNFKYGGPHGFAGLFVQNTNYEPQWKYSVAPDADARAILAAYWALRWSSETGQTSEIADTLTKAGKLGDYLRYSLYDKYFKKVGNCVGPYQCQGGSGKESAHYLLSWYFGWGGSLSTSNGWAWRIADGAAHVGYQNPITAYALANEVAMRPKGATAIDDWRKSLERQLEFYSYLQSVEGAFAGGATNTWNGRYDTPPNNLTYNTFHGMFYDWQPVYHVPPSNNWFGMQPWSVDRLAQYYYVTGDDKVKSLLDKWVSWVVSEISFSGDSFQLPEELAWEGIPPNVHVRVTYYSSNVGSAGATARTLIYYAAKSNNATVKSVAKKLLDTLWLHQTTKGISIPEEVGGYSQFNGKVYVPAGWTGVYPNGDVIDSSSTFISLRSFYKQDPDWPKVEAYLNGGPVPKFTYHRFWAQTDLALAYGAYGLLFNE